MLNYINKDRSIDQSATAAARESALRENVADSGATSGSALLLWPARTRAWMGKAVISFSCEVRSLCDAFLHRARRMIIRVWELRGDAVCMPTRVPVIGHPRSGISRFRRPKTGKPCNSS